MGLTNFPNGISVYGVPIQGGAIITTGNIWFLDSVNGSNNYDGKSKDQPFGTLKEAVKACITNHDDYILVAAGHAENLSPTAALAGVTINKNGIHIIGLGSGAKRPTFTPVALVTDDSIDIISITGSSVEIANIIIAATTIGNTTAQIDVAGANCTIRNCHIKAGAEDLVACITIPAAGTGAIIKDNYFQVTADGPGAGVKFEAVGSANVQVINNHFVGQDGWDEGAIYSAVAHTDCLVKDNRIAKGVGIVFSAAATGLIDGNISVVAALALDATGIDPGACYIGTNYCNHTAATKTAKVYPDADAA